MLGERVADRLFFLSEEAGRPGVRHVGHDFNAGVAEGGEPARGFREGVFQISIRAEGESHIQRPLVLLSNRTSRPDVFLEQRELLKEILFR